MKKFSTILAIAAVAVTSVFGLSSCDKSDDSINQAITPAVTCVHASQDEVKNVCANDRSVRTSAKSQGKADIKHINFTGCDTEW